MKLSRYGEPNLEKPGILDSRGQLRDLSNVIPDLNGAALSDASLERLRQLDLETLPIVTGNPRVGACVAGVGKFICIGLNYRQHAVETGASIPTEPILFLKATSSIGGANDDIIIPRGSTKTDWEVELGVVIGKPVKYVT